MSSRERVDKGWTGVHPWPCCCSQACPCCSSQLPAGAVRRLVIVGGCLGSSMANGTAGASPEACNLVHPFGRLCVCVCR